MDEMYRNLNQKDSYDSTSNDLSDFNNDDPANTWNDWEQPFDRFFILDNENEPQTNGTSQTPNNIEDQIDGFNSSNINSDIHFQDQRNTQLAMQNECMKIYCIKKYLNLSPIQFKNEIRIFFTGDVNNVVPIDLLIEYQDLVNRYSHNEHLTNMFTRYTKRHFNQKYYDDFAPFAPIIFYYFDVLRQIKIIDYEQDWRERNDYRKMAEARRKRGDVYKGSNKCSRREGYEGSNDDFFAEARQKFLTKRYFNEKINSLVSQGKISPF